MSYLKKKKKKKKKESYQSYTCKKFLVSERKATKPKLLWVSDNDASGLTPGLFVA